MKVNCRALEEGVELIINEKKFILGFPKEVWADYPEPLKKLFVDNYAFLKSLHLPQFLNDDNIQFNTSYPLFKNEILNCMQNNIPFCADIDNVSTAERLKRFINLDFEFKDFEVKHNPYDLHNKRADEKAVLSLSFGKESLLSFALAKELGLEPSPVTSYDDNVPIQNEYKKDIACKFSEEHNTKIWQINNGVSGIHDYEYWNIPKTEWGYGQLITEYFFNMLPVVHLLNSRYVLLGNEKSCDGFYFNREGYISYPVYDQTSQWLIELNKIAKLMISNQAGVVSLVEPIYELAIIKLLHKRYPEIGKYLMSCIPDNSSHDKPDLWCGHCSKCARVFIFLKANNIDPSKVGFKTDMLSSKHEHLFSFFRSKNECKNEDDYLFGYDTLGMGKDELIHSFYLAYKNGSRGYLINKFKKNYLNEAKEKEEEFNKKFFGIHSSKTIPHKLIRPLHSIFEEELN